MSDIFEVLIVENPLEIIFDDQPLEISIQEDNFDVLVNSDSDIEITIDSNDLEILTIAEQGPPGAGSLVGLPIASGNNPPSNPSTGDLWLDTN